MGSERPDGTPRAYLLHTKINKSEHILGVAVFLFLLAFLTGHMWWETFAIFCARAAANCAFTVLAPPLLLPVPSPLEDLAACQGSFKHVFLDLRCLLAIF